MKTKQCSKCKEVKPIIEFGVRNTGKYRSQCKLCERAYEKTYRQSRKGKAYRKAYRQSDKCKACDKEYKQSSKYKAYQQTQEYKDNFNAYMKIYRQSPKYKIWEKAHRQSEKYKDYHRSYEQSEVYKTYRQSPKRKATNARQGHKRRTLMKSLLCDLTAEQWEEIKASQDYRCAMCGEIKPLARDHIFPLSKGGAFTKSNIQGLCRSCNSSKSNKIINIDTVNLRIQSEIMAYNKD